MEVDQRQLEAIRQCGTATERYLAEVIEELEQEIHELKVAKSGWEDKERLRKFQEMKNEVR